MFDGGPDGRSGPAITEMQGRKVSVTGSNPGDTFVGPGGVKSCFSILCDHGHSILSSSRWTFVLNPGDETETQKTGMIHETIRSSGQRRKEGDGSLVIQDG